MWCRTCFLFQESQEHLLQCGAILSKLKNSVDFSIIRYSMLFDTLEKQDMIAKAFFLILNTRLGLIEEIRKSP